jgi:hypothetical protein
MEAYLQQGRSGSHSPQQCHCSYTGMASLSRVIRLDSKSVENARTDLIMGVLTLYHEIWPILTSSSCQSCVRTLRTAFNPSHLTIQTVSAVDIPLPRLSRLNFIGVVLTLALATLTPQALECYFFRFFTQNP